MRVIDCQCGETLKAANDDDLLKVLREHMEQGHEEEASEQQARELVEQRAYTATDA